MERKVFQKFDTYWGHKPRGGGEITIRSTSTETKGGMVHGEEGSPKIGHVLGP